MSCYVPRIGRKEGRFVQGAIRAHQDQYPIEARENSVYGPITGLFSLSHGMRCFVPGQDAIAAPYDTYQLGLDQH